MITHIYDEMCRLEHKVTESQLRLQAEVNSKGLFRVTLWDKDFEQVFLMRNVGKFGTTKSFFEVSRLLGFVEGFIDAYDKSREVDFSAEEKPANEEGA